MSPQNPAAIKNIRCVLEDLTLLLKSTSSKQDALEKIAIIPTKTIALQNLMLQFLEAVAEKVNEDPNPLATMAVSIPEDTPQHKLTKCGHRSRSTNGLTGRLEITFENNARYEPTEEDQKLPDEIWSNKVFSINDLLPILQEISKKDTDIGEIISSAELSAEQCSQLTKAILYPTFLSQVEADRGQPITPSAHR